MFEYRLMSKFSGNFKFTDRPPNPWQFTRPAPVATNIMWHHIIPFALLRDVWSHLADKHVDTALPSARVAIRQYLLLLNSQMGRVDELVDRMRAETGQRIAGHNPLKVLDRGDILLLNSTVAFPAWDLVEGPKARSDDPQQRFDRFRVGLKPEELRRMTVLERLNDQLSRFVAAPMAPLDALSQAMAMAANDLKMVREPIRFRSEMWVRNAVTQKWSKAV
jgi:hypothetical protein